MARWECCTPQGLVSTAELEPTAGQVVSRPSNDTILAPDRRSGRFLQVRTTRTRHHRTASGKRPTGQDYVLCKPWVSPAGCAPSPTAVESGRGFPQVQMPRAEDDGTRWLAPCCIAGTLGAGEPRRVWCRGPNITILQPGEQSILPETDPLCRHWQHKNRRAGALDSIAHHARPTRGRARDVSGPAPGLNTGSFPAHTQRQHASAGR